MASGFSGVDLGRLGVILGSGTVAAMTDDQLIDRFAAARGEPSELAFAALVARHGPMVLGVCRRILRDEQAAEDAFQATFLVLARRAGTFPAGDSVGRWLHGVSRRVAGRARSARGRPSPKAPTSERLGTTPPDAAEIAELRGVLDEEIGRLPGRLRESVVLCHLEGLTLDEAATRMGCAAGTAGSRLSRARGLLRSRLTRRGFSPALIGLNIPGLREMPSVSLLKCTTLIATGRMPGAIPTAIGLLARSTLKEMMMTKVLVAAFLAAGGMTAAGAFLASRAAIQDGPEAGSRGQGRPNGPSPALPGESPRVHDHVVPKAEEERGRILALIATFRTLEINREEVWGAAIRDLALIGKPAVPDLIEELDRTTENRPLRALGFTLRAIGDPRAVPSLIRAIPRTLVEPGSDYGLQTEDAELLAFLRRHDLNKEHRATEFNFGMPFREILGALHAMTGQRFGEDQLNFVNLEGGASQQRLQRRLFRELAKRWADWWEAENWRRYTDDPAFARVEPPPPEGSPEAAPPTAQPFPIGGKVKESSGWANVSVGPPEGLEYSMTFKDLDIGRESKWPGELGDPKTAEAKVVATWAAREGFDLQGVEFRPTGADRSFYALRGVDLRAWQVDNGLYGTIVAELRGGKSPDLGRPAGEYLMDRDPTTGAYRPEKKATFLYVTREGTTGILQVTGLITELFGKEDIGMPAQENATRGFYRGVQFQYKSIFKLG